MANSCATCDFFDVGIHGEPLCIVPGKSGRYYVNADVDVCEHWAKYGTYGPSDPLWEDDV